jgi:hypothetical protein
MMDDTLLNYRIGKRGYEAYASSADWKNFQGNKMPEWEELPEAIKTHWIRAAFAIRNIPPEFFLHDN